MKELLPRPLRRCLGRARHWYRSLPSRTRAQKARLLASPTLSAEERALLAPVESRVSFHDDMFHGNCEEYFRIGLSAIRCVDEALAAAKVREVRIILDMPSGYGRILRFLVRRFPAAEVYASELRVDAVRFCAETFGAEPVCSRPDFDALSLETRFDLIWCGSLVTHLDTAPTLGLLRFFARQLAPGGLLVFTTLGDYAAGRVPEAPASYALPRERASVLADAYARSGHGYIDYPGGVNGYGLTLTSPAWVRAVTRQVGGLREVYFRERGWHEHQDVFGFVR